MLIDTWKKTIKLGIFDGDHFEGKSHSFGGEVLKEEFAGNNIKP